MERTEMEEIKRTTGDFLKTARRPANTHIESIKEKIQSGMSVTVWQDNVLKSAKVLALYKSGALCKVGKHREFFQFCDIKECFV